MVDRVLDDPLSVVRRFPLMTNGHGAIVALADLGFSRFGSVNRRDDVGVGFTGFIDETLEVIVLVDYTHTGCERSYR